MLFFILGYFLPFYPSNSPKNRNFKKMKKPLEISSFYKSVPKIKIIWCTVPEIWCITDAIVIFHFGLSFPFYTFNLLEKWKFQKNKKNSWRYHFTQVYRKSWSYGTLILKYGADRCNCYLSFWSFLPFYLSNNPNNQNFIKWKKHPEISSFYTCVPKIMIRWFTVPEIWCMMDRQMEKVRYRGGCPT